MEISELQVTGCSVGEQRRNPPVEFDGQAVGVERGLVVPNGEEFTAGHRNVT